MYQNGRWNITQTPNQSNKHENDRFAPIMFTHLHQLVKYLGVLFMLTRRNVLNWEYCCSKWIVVWILWKRIITGLVPGFYNSFRINISYTSKLIAFQAAYLKFQNLKCPHGTISYQIGRFSNFEKHYFTEHYFTEHYSADSRNSMYLSSTVFSMLRIVWLNWTFLRSSTY